MFKNMGIVTLDGQTNIKQEPVIIESGYPIKYTVLNWANRVFTGVAYPENAIPSFTLSCFL